MKKIILCLFIFAGLLESSSAEEINQEMRAVYAAFKRLQVFIASPSEFEKEKNQKEIESTLSSISSNFHTVDDMKSRYKGEPGFEPTARLVHEMLDDSLKRFREGEKEYTLWRLRGLSNHCVTCHVSYNVKLSFDDKDSDLSGLSEIEKADFYFSSRQFEKAADSYMKAVKSDKNSFQQMVALRRWLLVQTRVEEQPKAAVKVLKTLLPRLELPQYEADEVKSWINSLENWSNDKNSVSDLESAETLIGQSISADPMSGQTDEVALLRATAVVHNLLPELKKRQDKAKGLYLLGLSYSKLNLFLIDELPEIYLRLAIETNPNSAIAVKAFNLYKDIVTLGFTGSAGTYVPDDVQVKLLELYNKAHGIPQINGKI